VILPPFLSVFFVPTPPGDWVAHIPTFLPSHLPRLTMEGRSPTLSRRFRDNLSFFSLALFDFEFPSPFFFLKINPRVYDDGAFAARSPSTRRADVFSVASGPFARSYEPCPSASRSSLQAQVKGSGKFSLPHLVFCPGCVLSSQQACSDHCTNAVSRGGGRCMTAA